MKTATCFSKMKFRILYKDFNDSLYNALIRAAEGGFCVRVPPAPRMPATSELKLNLPTKLKS